MLKEIYLRQYSAAIIELFEKVLDENNITIPSEEDDQKEPDNNARLYGMVYAELEDAVTGILSDFGEAITTSFGDVELVDAYNGSAVNDEAEKSYSFEERVSRKQLAKELYEYFLNVSPPSMTELRFECMVQPDEEDALEVYTQNVLLGNVANYMFVLELHRKAHESTSVGPVDCEAIAIAAGLRNRLSDVVGICMRNIKLSSGMTGEYVVIATNATDECIELQLRRNSYLEEKGIFVEDEFDTIKISGAEVVVLCDQDSDNGIEIDAEFDRYNF